MLLSPFLTDLNGVRCIYEKENRVKFKQSAVYTVYHCLQERVL